MGDEMLEWFYEERFEQGYLPEECYWEDWQDLENMNPMHFECEECFDSGCPTCKGE